MLGQRSLRGQSDLLGSSLLDLVESLFRFCLFSDLMVKDGFSSGRRQQIWGSHISLLQAGIVSGSTSTAQFQGWALLKTRNVKGLLHRGRGWDTSISIALLGALLASGEKQVSLALYPGAMFQLMPLTPVTPGPRGPC